uniref:mRNA interferase RelE/StbE n=1 Tax=Candidatus Kentrum sp. SD TaxID=2126332 RepID=A0A450Z1T5_9GAMM|nr:MAG: mRNA interferase RelE/StbE [Candidatus Kentron sp. SD]VFK47727.1 MAG: mRNA interferase RelE/StbE [Candidatus Kentron sp. SD]VFK80338.1 MAG: mRNA interferase RelE/StbE [Candidatus Kentron sp. SD]
MALKDCVFEKEAAKWLDKPPSKKIRDQILARIARLKFDPAPPGSRKVRSERDGYYEVRRIKNGPYRIIYGLDVGDCRLVITRIGHRKNVYD